MTHGADTGIVIVTFNSADHIGACLAAAVPTGAEIVVVDNASGDDTREVAARYPVRVIANPRNPGFAAAVNQGFRAMDRELVLLLNPDAILQTPLDPLCALCRRPNVGAAAGMLVDPDGLPQTGFAIRSFPTPAALAFEALLLNRLWPGNPVNRHYRCMGKDLGQPARVEQPAGACLMIRRSAWTALGGFDENFFPVWFEDVDFCRRLDLTGFELWYSPEVVARHSGGHSVGRIALEIRQFYWYRSLLRYSAKHFRPSARRAVCVAVMTGCLLRMIGVVFGGRGFREWNAFGRVLRLAGRYLCAGREVAPFS